MDVLVRKLGSEKYNIFINDFNKIVDKYRQIANGLGYSGKLKFKKEGGRIVIFVEI